MFDGDYRVGAAYRSQWQTVPVKYNTFSMYGERRIKPRQLQKDMIGVGFIFNNDRAGDARYGTTQAYLSGSYIILAKKDSSLIISPGVNIGWCQVGFDYSKMTFDNQFDGLQYTKTISSGEQFTWTQRNFFDMSAGLVVQYITKKRNRITYGLGVHHLTSPVISYQGNDFSRLDYKLTNIISYQTQLRENTDLIAEALFSYQGKNYEVIPHASLKYYFDKKENKAVLGGLCFRARDAVIVRLGYHYRLMQSGISYDINVSRFNAASNYRGGFEIFINSIIRLKPGFVAKKRMCPLFM
jgi:type IX secretion system PorP/SprF family membrane protein